MTCLNRILRFFSFPLVLTVVAGCDGDSDRGYQRPANVPAEARMIQPTAPRYAYGLREIAGGEHGVAYTTRANELHVFRAGREIVTKDVPLDTCPATGGFASPRLYVLADRVVMFDDDCGLWAFLDGDPTPRPIASVEKGTHRFGGSEDHEGIDLETERWVWEGGPIGPRSWLGPKLAFHRDSLFFCVVPLPKSTSDLPSGVIWRTDIDGLGVPVRVAELATSSCDTLLVDDDAIYVEDAMPRSDEERGTDVAVIDRIDRKTNAVTRLARFPRNDSYVAEVAQTATHLYLLEAGMRGKQAFSRAHRFPKAGGPMESSSAEHRFVDGLRSDGTFVFFVANDDQGDDVIQRIDGTTETTMVKSQGLSQFSFAAGAGELVWDEVGVTGDDSDDAIFAMPSTTTPGPR